VRGTDVNRLQSAAEMMPFYGVCSPVATSVGGRRLIKAITGVACARIVAALHSDVFYCRSYELLDMRVRPTHANYVVHIHLTDYAE